MANENELQVIFGADGSKLEKTLAELEADLKRFNKQLSSTTDARGIADLNKKLKETAANMKLLRNFDGFTKMRTSSIGASDALRDLSRVAQDVPYGFVGIQNNLNPLLESFGRLKAETGSGKQAFKALAGSLVGVGGLGLALGVVSAAFTLYQNGFGAWIKRSKEAKEATDAHKASLDGIVSDVASEAAKVSILVNAIQSETLSKKQRNQAIEELKRINPNYFGQLKDEKILIDNLGGAYNAYLQGIVAAAQSKVFEKKLEAAFEKKINLDLSVDPGSPSNVIAIAKNTGDEAFDAFRKAYNIKGSLKDSLAKSDVLAAGDVFDRYGNFLGEQTKKGFIAATPFFDGTQIKKESGKIQDEIDFLLNKIGVLGKTNFNPFKPHGEGADKELKILKGELEGYRKELEVINELRKEGLLPKFREDEARDLELKVLDLLNKIDAREVLIKIKPKLEIDAQLNELQIQKIEQEANNRLAFTKIQAPLSLIIDTKGVISQAQDAANKALKNSGLTEFKSPAAIIPQISFSQTGNNLQKAYGDLGKLHAEAYNQSLKVELGKRIGETVGLGVEDAFLSIGTGLAEIFSGGGFAAAAEGFLGIIGGVLQEVGRQVIVASTLVQALKASLASLFATPAIPLAIGIGLVALGGILKSIKLDKPRKFAEGGIVRGPTMGIVGENGPEAIIPLSRMNSFSPQQSGGTVVFEIEGRKLRGVLIREEESGRRMHGK